MEKIAAAILFRWKMRSVFLVGKKSVGFSSFKATLENVAKNTCFYIFGLRDFEFFEASKFQALLNFNGFGLPKTTRLTKLSNFKPFEPFKISNFSELLDFYPFKFQGLRIFMLLKLQRSRNC